MLWAVFIWQLGVYVAVYVLSPYHVAEHLSTSLDRVLLHLMPLGVAGAAASLGQPAANQVDRPGAA